MPEYILHKSRYSRETDTGSGRVPSNRLFCTSAPQVSRLNWHSLGIAQESFPYHDAACASIILVVQNIIPSAYVPVADDRNVKSPHEGFHHGEVGRALPSSAGRRVASVQREESCAGCFEVSCKCKCRRHRTAETQFGGDRDT